VLFGALAGGFAALGPACSLDWQVRADAADGATVADSTLGDVAVTETSVDDAPADAPIDGPDCTGLQMSVDSTRAKAKQCAPVGTPCSFTTVTDECGCQVVVWMNGSTLTTDYASAVTKLTQACGMPSTCATTCKALPAMNTWICVEDGPLNLQCFPY
jgi:hypothetical protein